MDRFQKIFNTLVADRKHFRASDAIAGATREHAPASLKRLVRLCDPLEMQVF
jgi:hypothetical protein